ncbi:MAG: hypothetical protein PHV42_04460 [Candidatus Pacebacteria bacterium]|nr:hypothetical protein [Candidatus Paceibacterota bacterium]
MKKYPKTYISPNVPGMVSYSYFKTKKIKSPLTKEEMRIVSDLANPTFIDSLCLSHSGWCYIIQQMASIIRKQNK